MSRHAAGVNQTHQAQTSSCSQMPRPWQEPCGNKRQKKQALQGMQGGGKRACNRSASGKKVRVTKRRIPAVASLVTCFSAVTDPRVNRRRRHLLIDIIVIAVCAVIANADTWKDIYVWGTTHQPWLQELLELPHGIPSRDTFRRTISRLDPDEFQQAFLRWLGALKKQIKGVVAIDGKTLRRSKSGDNKPLHIVSAWASEQHLALGQRLVDGKSNEITAIPELLEMLQLKGAIVTIDAMGCQKEIAAQIVDAKGDYCLAVKGNQETLAVDIGASFNKALETDFADTVHHETHTREKGHGRRDERDYYTMPIPDTLRTAAEWKGLKSIGMTITYRGAGSGSDGEVRYYINSFPSDAQRFAMAVRSHWGIENSLHWVMDVTFREDESRIRKDHGGENVSWLRRLAISLIKQETARKDSIRSKRIRAGYDITYLEQILNAIHTQN